MSSVQSPPQNQAITPLGNSSKSLPVKEFDKSISIIIPTYNESDNIRRVVERVRRAVSSYDYEVIIVDDDSPDGTWRIADRLYHEVDAVKINRRTDEKGLATAVASGFRQSSKKYCAVIDADLQHPPEQLPTLLQHATAETDVVIGSRYTDFGRIENWPLWRHLVSRGATHLAKSVLPETDGLSDPLSGFFIVRRDILKPDVIAPSGYKILLEILAKCEYDGVVEVPYVFMNREHGDSKLTLGEYVSYLKHLKSLRIAGR